MEPIVLYQPEKCIIVLVNEKYQCIIACLFLYCKILVLNKLYTMILLQYPVYKYHAVSCFDTSPTDFMDLHRLYRYTLRQMMSTIIITAMPNANAIVNANIVDISIGILIIYSFFRLYFLRLQFPAS